MAFTKNIWKEYNYDRFIQSLHEHSVEFEEVHVIPFTEDFETQIIYKPEQCFGSNRFIKICDIKKFNVYKSFKPIEEFYPTHLWFNAGDTVKWVDLKINHPVFIKPFSILLQNESTKKATTS